jgi:Asp-tRNA(Asn)/Glu-tRNA(Gln) amidotransferase A subunit family amidase
MNGIVGIKPSVGLVSRAGIIPISASQDTAGPMTRTVRDGALILEAICGPDTRDPATQTLDVSPDGLLGGLAAALDAAALTGARVGVARGYAGFHPGVDALLEQALGDLRNAGATVIDPVPLPAVEEVRPHEQVVMETEFKAGIASYLATRSTLTRPRNLSDLIDFNRALAAKVMPHFGQERFEAALARGEVGGAEHAAARQASLTVAATDGIDASLAGDQLDIIVAPTSSPAWMIDWINGDHRTGGCSALPAVAGYPHVTVPMGFVEHLPVGLSFIGGGFGDRKVISLAHAYEQCSAHQRPATPDLN